MAQIRFIILSSILTALTAAEKKQFCKCIETRKFKEMGLQSISWDGDKEVLLFTEPEFNFYSLIEEKQGLTFMDIASARVGSIAKRDKYNRAIAYVKDQTVKATYMFRLDHDGRQGQKHIILLVTNKGTLSGNFKDAAWNVVQPNGEELPDFSLASFPKQEMRLTGFVICEFGE